LGLPLLGATVGTHTRLIPLRLRFPWFAPSCGFSIFSPALVHATCLRVSSHALLASCRVLDFLWPPRGMPETPNFTPSALALGLILVWCAAAWWDWFDPRSGGGACSHCDCVFLLPVCVLLSRVGFLCGSWYARWLLGCGSDYCVGLCGVTVSRYV